MKLLEEVLAKSVKKVEAAERLGVSRVTLDKWLCRYRRYGAGGLCRRQPKKRPPARNRTPEIVEQLVEQIAEEYWYDGVEILSDRLFKESGIRLHPVTIYRVLKRRGARYDDRWTGTKKRQKIQLYAHKQAGKELQMDTKYPFGYKVGKVFYTVIDDATRWTYAKAYPTANQANTLDFLAHLRDRAPFDIQKIRTDNGTEFIGHEVRAYLAQKETVQNSVSG